VKVVERPEELGPLRADELTVTVGNFDGFHRGHAAVMGRLVARARARGGTSVAVTFDPHPVAVVAPAHAPSLLTTTDEKVELLEPSGLDAVVVVRFTADVAGQDARDFMAWLGVGRGSHLVLGHDFHMGRDRQCDLGRLSELGAHGGYGLDVVPPVMHEGRPISSSRIRKCVREGHVEDAGAMLGRPHFLRGRVVEGSGRGRSLASPTANLELPPGKLLPADGVYLVEIPSLEGRPGVMYVGRRPTFGEGARRAEVHVFDLERDLYGIELSIDVLGLLRGDVAFESADGLREQIREDVARARSLAAERQAGSSDGGSEGGPPA